MNKRKKERFGFYRVALCRGLGFRKITEEDFQAAYIFSKEPLRYLQKGRYAVFSVSEVHEGYLANGKRVFCTDDYIYIRKMYRQ